MQKKASIPRQGQKSVVLALCSSEALELRKWAVLGQIDDNHTSSQLALSHGGQGEGGMERVKEGLAAGGRGVSYTGLFGE